MTVVQSLDDGGFSIVHRQSKFILPLLVLLTARSFARNTTVHTKSGTIVVVGASTVKIVIAADSRVDYDSGSYDDHGCKITVLSDKFVFDFIPTPSKTALAGLPA